MSRSRILFFLLSAVVVFPLLAATLLRAADTGRPQPEEDSFYKYLAVFSETLGLVRQAYVDEPDMDTLMAGALDGTTDALDPFSLYVPASEVSGYRVAARDAAVGCIADLVVDDRTWCVTELVADTRSWLAGNPALISPDAVDRIEAGTQCVPYNDRDSRRGSPCPTIGVTWCPVRRTSSRS